jgi:parallel beta-helix repeat protein/predicted outer membrane repeat protein
LFSSSTGTISLSDSILRGNTAGDSGGAIRSHGGITISNTLIENNTAQGQGGGIALSGASSNLTLSDSQVLTNSVSDDGGGLYIGSTSSGATLNDSLFSGNQATDKGGAINNAKALTIDNGSQLLGNTAAQGGAVYSSSSATATVHNTCISGNSSKSVYRGSSPALDFTGNWWGAANGPSSVGTGSGNSVSNYITYSGFLTTNSLCQ